MADFLAGVMHRGHGHYIMVLVGRPAIYLFVFAHDASSFSLLPGVERIMSARVLVGNYKFWIN